MKNLEISDESRLVGIRYSIPLAIPTGDPGQVDLDGLFCGGHMQPVLILTSEAAVMAMAISYNWLFLWDYTFYKWG